jgi:hypothetical protein
VEADPWEDPIRPAEAIDPFNNPLPKDAVWIGMKRAKICLFVVFVVIAGIVTRLTTALIRSERDQGEGTSVSLSGFNNSATRSPSPFPPPSRPLREQLLSPTPSPSSSEENRPDGVGYPAEDNGSGTGSGGGSGSGSHRNGGNRT